jgi:hypothetical protein
LRIIRQGPLERDISFGRLSAIKERMRVVALLSRHDLAKDIQLERSCHIDYCVAAAYGFEPWACGLGLRV